MAASQMPDIAKKTDAGYGDMTEASTVQSLGVAGCRMIRRAACVAV